MPTNLKYYGSKGGGQDTQVEDEKAVQDAIDSGQIEIADGTLHFDGTDQFLLDKGGTMEKCGPKPNAVFQRAKYI